MKPAMRCIRYGEENISAAKAIGSATSNAANTLPLKPPSHSVPSAMAQITTNAPMSGSDSSNPPTSTITTNIGQNAVTKVSFTFILRTV
jgi:hypothetical protein